MEHSAPGRRVALVTGAGGNGSGRAIARRFAREGVSVIVSDIDNGGGTETVRLIEANGGQAIFHPCDVRGENAVRHLILSAEERFGGLDYLINNASAPFRPEAPLEYWKEAVETDLLGAMYATRAAIDVFRRHGGGSVVNMSSTSALPHGRTPPAPSYDAAKAGLLRLTTMLAFLGDAENIRINCLAPGWIATPHVREYWESLTPEQREARGAPSHLLGLDEVAAAVLRLATDQSLAGRVMFWWPDDPPALIPWGDRGYANLDSVPGEPLRL
jgi:NAD(P)-dependent dehydrogenase (short-subunit alcohol dehydrogenase family)